MDDRNGDSAGQEHIHVRNMQSLESKGGLDISIRKGTLLGVGVKVKAAVTHIY